MADGFKHGLVLSVVIVVRPASSEELFPDCLEVKLFTSLPLFVAFYDQQGVLRTYSSSGAEAPTLTPAGNRTWAFINTPSL